MTNFQARRFCLSEKACPSSYLAFPAFLARCGIHKDRKCVSKMPEKSWGLFGGKWEAKTDFCGLGGQISVPCCALYS